MKKPLAAVLGSLALTACPWFCIARGTLVSTPRGQRRIEELIEQDTVWCIDPATGERVTSPVIAIRSAKREVMRLAGPDFELTCTTDHPLYDPSSQSWAPAGDWVLGKRSELLFVPEGKPPRVVVVDRRELAAGVAEVFDLSVQHELHNFVAAGVLVHNKSPERIPPRCSVEQDGRVTELAYGAACTTSDGGIGSVDCAGSPDGGVCVPNQP